MSNQVQVLNLNVEFRIQLKRYLRKLRELALGGIAAGVLLLTYSQTAFPGAKVTASLLDKLGAEAAVPDANFLVVALASCAATLALTGWPPAKAFRRWFAIPYLKFCFDLTGTALGVFLPVCIALSTPSEFLKHTPIILLGLFYFILSSIFLWAGKYALSERIQSKLQTYPGFYPHVLPTAAAAYLVLTYLGSK